MSPLLHIALALQLAAAGPAPPASTAPGPRLQHRFATAAAPAPRPSPPSSDRWFGEDKLKHFFMSLAIVNVAYGGTRTAGVDHRLAVTVSAGLGAAAGLGKELYDHNTGGDASARDLLWDALGVAAGAVLAAHTR